MMYLLDTDHLSIIQRGGAQALTLEMRLSTVPDDEVVTSIINYEEQLRVWMDRTARAQKGSVWVTSYHSLTDNLTTFCAMTILPFDETAAAHFDALQAAKVRIGTQDLKIASIALTNNATVLTRNTRDFGKVPGLLFADWTI